MSKLDEFCRLVSVQSDSTASEYRKRLRDFESFINRRFNVPDLDSFFGYLKNNDVYSALGEYNIDMRQRGLSNSSIISRITIAKNFLEYNEIPISRTVFKLRVRTPKQGHGDIEALSKEMVRKILLSCNNDKRLQTYLLFLATTGMRATEAMSIRLRDIDWQYSKVTLRAKYTKTQRPRYVYLTKECMEHMKDWKQYRERIHKIVDHNGKSRTVEKKFAPDDLFFTTGRHDYMQHDPRNVYNTMYVYFAQLCDRNGFEARSEDGKRRKFTLHSFRRFVKSTISDLGYQDYSEWFIGHAGSTYYRKTEAEKLEIFKKVEPYLTFLDYSKLEAKGADTETKLAESQKTIEELRKQMVHQREGFREEMQAFKRAVRDTLKEMLTSGTDGLSKLDD